MKAKLEQEDAGPEAERLTFDRWPFYRLTRAHSRYQDALSSALAGTDMDAPTWRIVMILKEFDWLSVSDIAAQANAKLSTITKATRRMEAAALVELRPAPHDRRVTEVRLTQSGRALIDPAEEAARHVFDRAFASFAPDRLELLQRLLNQLAENLR